MIQMKYELLINQIQFLAQKDGLLIVKFDKSSNFEDLPDPFHICLVRSDLLCITISIKKVKKSEEDIKNKMIAIFNVSYSGLFDGDSDINKERKNIIIEKRCY